MSTLHDKKKCLRSLYLSKDQSFLFGISGTRIRNNEISNNLCKCQKTVDTTLTPSINYTKYDIALDNSVSFDKRLTDWLKLSSTPWPSSCQKDFCIYQVFPLGSALDSHLKKCVYIQYETLSTEPGQKDCSGVLEPGG